MIYKLTTIASVLCCIFLGTRMSVVHKDNVSLMTKLTEVQLELDELSLKNQKLNELNNYMLEENAQLIMKKNEVEFIKSKPLIIYRNEKNSNVNDYASEQYNELLSRRYDLE